MRPQRIGLVLLVVFLGIGSSACRHTPITYGLPPAALVTPPALLTTTAEILNFQLGEAYDGIKSFQATTEMTARVGSVYRSTSVTEFTESSRSFIFFRKDAMLRMQGQRPIFGGTAFDLASSGADFRLSIPYKNLFVLGADSAPATSKSALENLRPHQLLSTMLIQPANLATERIHIEDDTDVDHSWYILQITKRGPDDTDLPDRSVWFNRFDFRVVRQRIFDEKGLIVSDTKYDKWEGFNGILFPMRIEAAFKKEGFGFVINTSDLKMNIELADDKFTFPQPEGFKVQEIK